MARTSFWWDRQRSSGEEGDCPIASVTVKSTMRTINTLHTRPRAHERKTLPQRDNQQSSKNNDSLMCSVESDPPGSITPKTIQTRGSLSLIKQTSGGFHIPVSQTCTLFLGRETECKVTMTTIKHTKKTPQNGSYNFPGQNAKWHFLPPWGKVPKDAPLLSTPWRRLLKSNGHL